MVNKPPCKNCPHRELSCHAHCQKYTEWLDEREKAKTWLKQQNTIDDYMISTYVRICGKKKRYRGFRDSD